MNEISSDPPAGRSAAARRPSALVARASALDLRPEAAVGYALPFALVVYLSLKGGGYDVIVRSEIGVLAWWAVLLAAVSGLIVSRSLPPPAKVALLLFGGFATWTTLGSLWGESAERGIEEAARVWGYVGVLAVAILAQGSGGLRRTAAAVGAAVAVVGILALLSRLHPSWFPPNEVAEFIPATASRISYPLGYWNGVAALIALGMPLLLWLASGARPLAARALAAAAVPPLLLAVYFTLSRGGAIDLACGAVVLVALHPRRLQLVPTLLIAGLGGGLLIVLASGRDALEAGLLTDTARSEGDQMLVATIGVCVIAAVAQTGLGLAARAGRIRWPMVPRRTAISICAAAALVVVAVGVAAGAPGKASDRFSEFKQPIDPGDTTTRFESASGNGRWQYWSAAAEAGAGAPLLGIGPGSYEFYWARDPGLPATVRDAHSLYVEAFGELGVPGLLLIVATIGWVLVVGVRRTIATSGPRRAVLAALVASAATFAVGAGLDWIWELAALPVIFVFVAAAVLAGDVGPGAAEGSRWRALPSSAAAIVGTLIIALPLLSAEEIRSSQDSFNAGDLGAALDAAEAAERYEPFAATPRLQQALVLERQGRLGQAAAAAREARDREDTNWRPWFILSRIEAQRGTARADSALAAFQRARELNPSSELFDDGAATTPAP